MKTKYSIYLEDITTLDVDVIVNAAHESLMGGGGVDGAIHRAAGEGLLQECMKIPLALKNSQVKCLVGDAKITKGYNLPCKHIIHTVAPKFVGSVINGKYKCLYPEMPEMLKSCYEATIRLANAIGAKSIAFPSLGTGGHAIPIEMAAPIAIKTVKEIDHNIEHVIFVVFSEKDKEVYEKVLKEI